MSDEVGRLRAVAAVVAVAVAGLVAACGDGAASSAEPPLSPEAAQGKELATSSGCAGCHSFTGGRSAGPTWKGLYGTEVELTDGSTVVADEAYLRQSIMDPRSQTVKGFGTVMPKNRLSESQVALIISYIKAIGPASGT